MEQHRNRLNELREQALQGGGEKRIEAQHAKGKLTARERLNLLLDPDSFEELGMLVKHRSTNFGLDKQQFLGDGVVTGYGRVNGRLVYVFSQDFTVLGGSLAEAHAKKICRVMDLAMKNGAPLIGLNDSGGARIQEGVVSLGGYADIFYRNVRASGVIPQLSAILGPCAGGAVYSPALTDFIFMAEGTSYMFVTGPNVVKTVTHEEVTSEELGGAKTHASKSGVTHFTAANEARVIQHIKDVLSFLPQNCEEDPEALDYTPGDEQRPALDAVVPESAQQPYDIREVVNQVCDAGTFTEVQKDYAENIVCGFARLAGKSIGVVANQPAFLGWGIGQQRIDEGGAFRAHVRRVQCSVARVGRRSGLLAWNRPGVERHHHQRRQTPVRLQRSHGATHHGHHAQGLRWRVRCHEQPAHRCGPRLCVADGGDCGHGRQGRGGDYFQARNRRFRRSGSDVEGEGSGICGAVCAPLQCSGPRLCG